MDRLVDSNIDPSFLDLLEDELPIVTFDDSPPDTMEIIDNYDQCTSINLFNRRKKKSLNSSVQNPVTSTMAETNLLDKNSENSLVSPTNASSTILRRLLETPETKAAERAAKKAKKANNLEPEEDPEAKPLSSPSSKAKKAKSEKADDSSSECETASIASSTASLSRKRKRSMTDFPPKKKAKKEPVLPSKKQPKSIKKGLQSPTVSKKLRQQVSPPNSRTSKNKNQQNLKSPKPKPKSVQLKLGMGKNGLSLKKPEKVTPVKPSLYGPKGGRRYLTKDDPDLFKPSKNDEIMPQKKKRGRPAFSKDKNNQEVQKDSPKGPMSKIQVEEKRAADPDTDPDSNAEQDDVSEEKEGSEDMPIKKRGRPFSKNKNQAGQKSPGAAVVKKTSGNSLKGPMSKVGTEKAKKSKIVIPLIDISGGIEVPSDTDDDDIDDESDKNFRPNMGNTKKAGQTGTQQKRKRKSKKKKRSLIVKPKKVMIPCVTISDDSDEDESEDGTEDTNENTENSDDENSVDVEATDDPDTDPNADQDDSSEASALPVKKKRGRPFSKDKTNQANQKNSLKGPMSKIVEEKANPDTDPNDSDQDDDSEDEEGTENSDENSDDSENSADDEEEEEEGPTEDSDSEDKPIINRSKKQFPATKLAKQLRMRQEQNMKKGLKKNQKNKLGNKMKNKTRSSRKLRT